MSHQDPSPAPAPFALPPYPYDRLDGIRGLADGHPHGRLDLSIGTPVDPAPAAVLDALADPTTLVGYPPSIGVGEYREAASHWMDRTFGVEVPVEHIGACIGTKELVAGLPRALWLASPGRDTVLYPAVSYPSYAMGAALAGCRAVPVPMCTDWSLDLDGIDPDDAARALCLWVNTPGNPAGGLDDLHAAAAWGRANGVLVASDECYAAFTWDGAPRTVLASGSEGVLAVHSLSKRSNLAGGRLGFYAGDPETVGFLRELRRHAGMMVPMPMQRAGIAALGDEAHVEAQRDRYRRRLDLLAEALESTGAVVTPPRGGFYLWVPAPDGDGWAYAEVLARRAGIVASPGDLYGDDGTGYVRLAMAASDDAFAAVRARFNVSPQR